MAAATLVSGPRAVALAAAVAPPAARGRYLAAFQYAFTAAGVVAPAVVALYSVAVWLPWVLVAASATVAIVGLGALASRLPASAVFDSAQVSEPDKAADDRVTADEPGLADIPAAVTVA
jgi:MFS family permease